MTWSSCVLSDQHPIRRPERLREQESPPTQQQSKSTIADAFAVCLALPCATQLLGESLCFPKASLVEENRPPSMSPYLYPVYLLDSESHTPVQNRVFFHRSRLQRV